MQKKTMITVEQFKKDVCGIYFLYLKGEVVYIGQALNIMTRINTHLHEKKKEFDSVSWVSVPVELLTKIEIKYIQEHDPKYNKNHKPIRANIKG